MCPSPPLSKSHSQKYPSHLFLPYAFNFPKPFDPMVPPPLPQTLISLKSPPASSTTHLLNVHKLVSAEARNTTQPIGILKPASAEVKKLHRGGGRSAMWCWSDDNVDELRFSSEEEDIEIDVDFGIPYVVPIHESWIVFAAALMVFVGCVDGFCGSRCGHCFVFFFIKGE